MEDFSKYIIQLSQVETPDFIDNNLFYAVKSNSIYDAETDDYKVRSKDLLPHGTYNYTVADAIVQDFKGSKYFPPCKMMQLSLEIEHNNRTYIVTHNLYSCDKGMKYIQYFADSTTIKRPVWTASTVIGCSGKCDIGNYESYSGEIKNKVIHFIRKCN